MAFALLTMALTVILQIFSSGLDGAGRSATHGRAVVLAGSLLAKLDAGPVPEKEEERTGETDGMRWRIEILPADGFPTGADVHDRKGLELYRIRLRIRWPRGNGEGEMTLNTLRLGRQP